MDKTFFSEAREKLGKSQKELARLLGTSLKAVQSFEQGWRKIPAHVERQLLFLMALKAGQGERKKTCWEILECPPEDRERCPAWEFKSGHLCWFINGTICRGRVQESWGKKMKICRTCPVFKSLLLP